MPVPVAVVVPWRGGCKYRDAAWEWVRAQYARQFPDWEIIEAPGPEPWVKAAAVMPAISATTAEIVVTADADCWTAGLLDAVQSVENGAAWSIPHRGVHRLSEEGTINVLQGADWEAQELAQRAYLGVPGGGFVVARRETLLEVPLDPRFVGWGQEDESWGIALWTLLGPAERHKVPLVHLWHPPQERLHRRCGSRAGEALMLRYRAASGIPEEMRRLIAEGQAC